MVVCKKKCNVEEMLTLLTMFSKIIQDLQLLRFSEISKEKTTCEANSFSLLVF
jgi:hypothetical protein